LSPGERASTFELLVVGEINTDPLLYGDVTLLLETTDKGETMTYRCYEDIKGQASAWRAALRVVDERIEEVRGLISRSDARMLFTSCGSPYFLGLATATLWREKLGMEVAVAPSSEVMLFPHATLPGDGNPFLVIATRSGETTETVRALETFSARFSGQAVVIGCRPGSTLEEMADVPITIPEAYDDVIPQTRSFGSMYLASQYMAALLAGDGELAASLKYLPDILPDLLYRWESEVRSLAEEDWDSAVFLGGGPLYGIATEASLKLIEMSLTKTACYHTLEVRHGPRSVVDDRTLVVSLGSLRGARHEDQVLAELSRGSRVLKLAPDGDGSRNGSISEIGVGPEVPEHALGMLYLPLLQLLAYHRAVHRGVDPDESHNLTSYVELSEG
jgi:glutamine---fructose-6-phosphate transaminase (isomerizing)